MRKALNIIFVAIISSTISYCSEKAVNNDKLYVIKSAKDYNVPRATLQRYLKKFSPEGIAQPNPQPQKRYLFTIPNATTIVCYVYQKSTGEVLYCYFESWTVYRPGNGKFDVEHIDPHLCTHISFTFLGINTDGSINILDPWESNNDGLNGFGRFIALKKSNPNLTAFVSMGGWNEGSEKYSLVAEDPVKRHTWVNSVLTFIEEHGFDGFDFDWEYPSRRDSDNPADRENFILMLKELYEVLHPKGYLVSAAVNGAEANIDISYDVDGLNRYLDFINIMSYDFHGAFDDYVGHHTPLYSADADHLYNLSDWNIAAGIDGWISRGVNISKVNMGIATYARTFTLEDPKNISLFAPIIGGGLEGPYTRNEGILGYNEICELYSSYERHWDDEQKVPHKVHGDQWIGYEDETSIEVKVEYAKSKGINGFMVWSFDTDDFRGLCGHGKYPLINTIKKAATAN